jgi:hypothetical protein
MLLVTDSKISYELEIYRNVINSPSEQNLKYHQC